MSIWDSFWSEIDRQLDALRTARTAADVFRILGTDSAQDGAARAFFAGGGGDVLPDAPLREAGWEVIAWEAPYYWCMRAPDGDEVSYVEGDVYRGNVLAETGGAS